MSRGARALALGAWLLAAACTSTPGPSDGGHDGAPARAEPHDGHAAVDASGIERYARVMEDMQKASGIDAGLALVGGEHPNAFAGLAGDKRVVLVNFPLLALVAGADDEFAALVGHELAHYALGHHEKTASRKSILGVASTLVGVTLGIFGIPVGDLAAGWTADIVDKKFNREQEEDADALGLDYLLRAGYDGEAALRFHRKLWETSKTSSIPLLNTHPSGPARIRHLEKLLADVRRRPAGS